MKDLYARLGLPARTGKREAIARAIDGMRHDPVTARAARHVLLEPRRKDVYDRTHLVVSTIGQLRANLGLSRAPNWVGTRCEDFDVAPMDAASLMRDLRNRTRATRQSRPVVRTTSPTEGAQASPRAEAALFGCTVSMVLLALALLGVAYILGAFEGQSRPPAPYEGSVQKRDGVDALSPRVARDARIDLERIIQEEFAAARPATADGEALRDRARLDGIRQHVVGRFERAGSRTDAADVELWVQQLARGESLPRPRTGVLARGFAGRSLAPLQIKTQPGANYYVKVVPWSSRDSTMPGEETLTAFIVGGEHFETSLPLGSYEIRYATGHDWYGSLIDFGGRIMGASYFRCDARFDFQDRGTYYSGYTIELIMQVHGNLETDPIDEDDF